MAVSRHAFRVRSISLAADVTPMAQISTINGLAVARERILSASRMCLTSTAVSGTRTLIHDTSSGIGCVNVVGKTICCFYEDLECLEFSLLFFS